MSGPESEIGVPINWVKLVHAGHGVKNAYAITSNMSAPIRNSVSLTSFGVRRRIFFNIGLKYIVFACSIEGEDISNYQSE